jgi:hypothetical protein
MTQSCSPPPADLWESIYTSWLTEYDSDFTHAEYAPGMKCLKLTSPGLDFVCIALLKALPSTQHSMLLDLFKQGLQTGTVPTTGKKD